MSYTFYHEKLEVWQMSGDLAREIYQVTTEFPKEEKFGLVSQLRRAAVSISSNLAEGSSRASKKDQAHFTSLAYTSLMEVSSQIVLSEKLGFISFEEEGKLKSLVETIAIKLNNLRRTQLRQVKEDTVIYETTTSPYTPEEQSSSDIPSSPKPYFAHETAVIDAGATIGNGTKIWHFSHIMHSATIGKNCNIGQNVFIANEVILGNNVKVQNNVSIYSGVICEDDVFLGPSMVFTNVNNPRSAVNRKGQYDKTRVKKGATIGANATIVCGNEIGAYAFIGAGAVVTKPIPSYALVIGNPAQQIGWMSTFGHRLDFDKEGIANCPESNEKYKLVDCQVIKQKI